MGGDGGDARVEAVLVDGVVEVRAQTPDRRQTCQSHVHRPRPMLHGGQCHGCCLNSENIQGPAPLQETSDVHALVTSRASYLPLLHSARRW